MLLGTVTNFSFQYDFDKKFVICALIGENRKDLLRSMDLKIANERDLTFEYEKKDFLQDQILANLYYLKY